MNKIQFALLGIGILCLCIGLYFMYHVSYEMGYRDGFVSGNNTGFSSGQKDGMEIGVKYTTSYILEEMCNKNKTFNCNNNQTICGCVNIPKNTTGG